jgi:tetratricopeptide (TPR) repeat protein
MRRRFRALLRYLIGSILLILLPNAVSGQAATVKGRWIQLETQSFTFYSNASERTTRRVATDLEELRLVLSKLTYLKLKNPIPTLIYVFKNRDSFGPYKPLYKGMPSNIGGYFQPGSHANFIAINAGVRGEDASSIVYHEYIHHFIETNLPWAPLWFNEGLAELYQTFTIVRRKARMGVPPAGHLGRLRNGNLMPLSQLFAVTHSSAEYNEADHQALYYAQSWALVHYLTIGNSKRREQLLSFLTLADQGADLNEAFRKAFGSAYPELESELRRYVSRAIFSYLERPLEIDLKTSISVREMPQEMVLCRLGELLALQVPARPEARGHFQAALQIQPGYGLALSGLGEIARRARRSNEAVDLLSQAAAAAPEDYLTQYRYGVALQETNGEQSRMIASLRRAITLRPDFGPAWTALSRAYVDTDQVTLEAIKDVEAALQRMPGRKDVAFNLLVLYLRAGRRDLADILVKRSFDDEPGYLQRARVKLFDSDLNKVHDLLQESRLDLAQELLDRLEARMTVDESRVLRSQIDQLRFNIKQIRAVDSYNRASEYFNSGEYKEARTILEELLESETDQQIAERATELLELVKVQLAGPQPGQPDTWEQLKESLHQFNELVAAGRVEEARQVLVAQRSESNEATVKWLDRKIGEIDSAIAYNRFIESYNRAVDLYNQGELEAAVNLLQKTFDGNLGEAEAALARDMIAEIRRSLGK